MPGVYHGMTQAAHPVRLTPSFVKPSGAPFASLPSRASCTPTILNTCPARGLRGLAGTAIFHKYRHLLCAFNRLFSVSAGTAGALPVIQNHLKREKSRYG